jgi:hypothetical protein
MRTLSLEQQRKIPMKLCKKQVALNAKATLKEIVGEMQRNREEQVT